MASVNSYRSRYSNAPTFEPEPKKPPPEEKPVKAKPPAEESSEESSSEEGERSEEESSSEEEAKPARKSPDNESSSSASSDEETSDDEAGKLSGVNGAHRSSPFSESESETPERRRPVDSMSGQADAVPWRRPQLRKVGRRSAAGRQPSSELPPWAEDAKRRLGDVPLPLQKPDIGHRWHHRGSAGSEDEKDDEEDGRPPEPALSDKMDWMKEKMLRDAAGRRPPPPPPPPPPPARPGAGSLEESSPEEEEDEDSEGTREDFSKLQQLEGRAKATEGPAEPKAAPWESVKLVPPPPPPPPPPPSRLPLPPLLSDKPPLTPSQHEKLERLRKTPRRRPDWGVMMAEISRPARRLRHVECRDRSAPIIHDLKRRGSEFIFESEKEKETPTDKLMNDIRSGVRLKRVKCNDRSRPNLQGLRKLRRQRTSEAFVNLPPEELMDSEPDELDDIDRVRDDLQSTRQMLGDEVKNRERLAKENKQLKAELKRVQEQLECSRISDAPPPAHAGGSAPSSATDDFEDDLGALAGEMAMMRDEAGASSREALLWQERCRGAEQELAALRARLEEAEHGRQRSRRISVENSGEVRRNKSSGKMARSRTKDKIAKTASQARVGREGNVKTGKEEHAKEDEESEELSEEDLDSEGERQRDADQHKKKQLRELKMCESKVSHMQTKVKHAKDERMHLKNRIKTLNQNMRDENRKYKELQREVKKMGAMLKDSDDEDSGEDSEEESEEETSEESESATESDTDEESSEELESDDEDLPLDERTQLMQERAKRHEDNEKAIKKGNYMLKTTAERLFDKLRSEKEEYRLLERQLNDLVHELG
ncbi:cytokinesis protein sepA-like isoform X3 [Pollicipes pollicipes]|uniref:cytokinesis protein sepA-like isoform X3 n=1 Tax=Pollicipes pollicipes TaxID=41117 RepID=UPI001884E45F|nr:cytokinesis protein sepA-like isoform X3 [Pollicipes pollicipes]